MTRAQTLTLTKLTDTAEVGGYTLPAEVTDAVRTWRRVEALTTAEPKPSTTDTAAAQLVSATAAGEPVDLAALGSAIREADEARHAHAAAVSILSEAREQAGNAAVHVTIDLTDRIITDHLRPALEDVYELARKAASDLGGHSLEPRDLLAAPAKVRSAYLGLPALVDRHQVIHAARQWVNNLAQRTPAQDTEHRFSEYRDPIALTPGWKPPARWPAVPAPSDPALRLLWLVGEEGQRAKPWLPTTAEQDARWVEVFGDATEHRRVMAAMSRAYAGQNV